ncbi:chorismate mutase [Ruminiclostridium cellulolyticum]|uniref:chorismate mutase n=1 Tax=Ruminiclostridium cellulolyticum (strain ATCC 35319 / DSM 5812 / JCM 6584 / H10) TaxID=394503 RepID=B8I2T8_RUMCH|nr:chorismate mutase [Ruminiclostridium cellulolyticum]ACL76081.1 chorismate mutase [Ruminiclostridium cellulolyticum H10]
MAVRAVRGAITVPENTKESIWEGTKELLVEIVNRNSLKNADIISAIFTVTHDLSAAFPAVAARQIGWNDIPLMCTNEIDVPGSLEKCVRVLIHINTEKTNAEINHVYLNGAAVLRPDLVK